MFFRRGMLLDRPWKNPDDGAGGAGARGFQRCCSDMGAEGTNESEDNGIGREMEKGRRGEERRGLLATPTKDRKSVV